MEVLRNNVKRKNVESSLYEVIEEVATHGNDHTENPVQNIASGRESNAYAGHSGGEDHVASMYKRRM